MSPTGDLLVTFIFLWGRCPLELAQRPPCVALALHLVRRSTPFGVTTPNGKLIHSARLHHVLKSEGDAHGKHARKDRVDHRRPFALTLERHERKSNISRSLGGERTSAGGAAGSNLPG
jgi:hypothetical protein